MSATINITCTGCNTTHEVTRTKEIPGHVVSMGCNYCPKCDDKADDYYEEWYNESDPEDKKPDPTPPNQTNLFPLYPDEKYFEILTEAPASQLDH